MKKSFALCTFVLALFVAVLSAQDSAKPGAQEPAFPYTPSLDVKAMDKAADPCADFFQYSCGGWKTNNPIPPDQVRWDVYAKLYQDNLNYLRGILEEAAVKANQTDSTTQKIGDFYGSCMDEATVEKRGLAPLQADLDAIAGLKSVKDITTLITRLQFEYGRGIAFSQGSTQDPDDSEQQIAEVDQGGLGLPDRDYYVKDDAKSKETRERYVQYVQKMFELLGDDAATATKNADTVMRMETALAKASMTRVDRRDPYKLKHKMKVAELSQLAPNIDWTEYYAQLQYPKFEIVNVTTPDFFKEVSRQITADPIADWQAYFRFHVVNGAAVTLSKKFVDANWAFNRQYLHGAKEQQPRWKRCVQYADEDLGEALGQVYVRKTFSPELKASTLEMVRRIEDAMGERIRQLDWMSPETKQQALTKLAGIRNKIGYPDKWRDYSSVTIVTADFAGNVQRAEQFERRRDINKVGQPVDHAEWGMSPPTVNAYYNSQMNDINFPAGVLQPPLYDSKIDDAPN
jgi:putative endopeptidase